MSGLTTTHRGRPRPRDVRTPGGLPATSLAKRVPASNLWDAHAWEKFPVASDTPTSTAY